MWTLSISCLINSFLDYSTEKSKPCLSKLESPSFLYINLKWSAKFQISRLPIREFWLNFIHFSGYNKIRLVSRLRKREDQALISISTILKQCTSKVYFSLHSLPLNKFSLLVMGCPC